MDFKPTYLYIKQHAITGKLYFGKTYTNPEKYRGSGVHWLRHIKKHGTEHVVTLWYCLFYDKDEITKFAKSCSEQWGIVESETWLNAIPESGLDSSATIAKTGKLNPMYGKHHSEDGKRNISEARKGILTGPRPESVKNKISETKTGVKRKQIQCPHCHKLGGDGMMQRWHFSNCKSLKLAE